MSKDIKQKCEEEAKNLVGKIIKRFKEETDHTLESLFLAIMPVEIKQALLEKEERIAELEKNLENERIKIAVIGVTAWSENLDNGKNLKEEYESDSLNGVMRVVGKVAQQQKVIEGLTGLIGIYGSHLHDCNLVVMEDVPDEDCSCGFLEDLKALDQAKKIKEN